MNDRCPEHSEHISGAPLPCSKCGMRQTAVWVEGAIPDGRFLRVLASPCESCKCVTVHCIEADPLDKI